VVGQFLSRSFVGKTTKEVSMTKKSMNRVFIVVILIYALAIGLAVLLRTLDCSTGSLIYTTYKDLIPLIIALPAAWLGYCIQKRNSYMQQLRSLWSKLVETIQHINQYTYIENPTKEQNALACQKLSVVIDEIRCVFTNINGLYPFEPLKTIHVHLCSVGSGQSATEEKLTALRQELFTNWKTVRDELLKEFDREQPTHFHSHYIKK
jgi:hypothetical protein